MWSLGVIAYILLIGYAPFADKQPNIARRIIDNRYHRIPEHGWNKVSELAKDFIARLLVRDPNIRYTAEQALQHPWLTANDDTPVDDLAPGYLERLRTFNLKRRLRAAVYTVVLTNKLSSLGIYLNSMMVVKDQE
jgi:calcium/calmodulin-dependent protein kinase I